MNDIIAKIKDEPFRLFFPLGLLFLLFGISVWIPLLWNPGSYPLLIHRVLVINGFMASFIAGFLMTAIPRFSETERANIYEVAFYFVGSLALIVINLLTNAQFAGLLTSYQAFILLVFGIKRIINRKQNPPYTFVFVFTGIVLWFLSGIDTQLGYHYLPVEFSHESVFLFLIIGIGSRLIPGILGHVDIVQNQKKRYENVEKFYKIIPPYIILLLGLFVASYFVKPNLSYLVRGICLLFVAIKYWRILQLPKIKSALTNCIWITAILISLSPFVDLMWTWGPTHSRHFFMISGVTLLTLLIATRVTRAHCSYNISLENSKKIYTLLVLVLIAMISRVSAILMSESYLKHLSYSAIVLVLAIGVWVSIFFPKSSTHGSKET